MKNSSTNYATPSTLMTILSLSLPPTSPTEHKQHTPLMPNPTPKQSPTEFPKAAHFQLLFSFSTSMTYGLLLHMATFPHMPMTQHSLSLRLTKTLFNNMHNTT
eukprot:Lithocolla_globosa_v1_NODE_10029_length_641_cov_60.346416.p2 type:complete len:103 gc:universal NODE_10029_length_641_cov_60.346416:388-80(-)